MTGSLWCSVRVKVAKFERCGRRSLLRQGNLEIWRDAALEGDMGFALGLFGSGSGVAMARLICFLHLENSIMRQVICTSKLSRSLSWDLLEFELSHVRYILSELVHGPLQ
jgi:hypothetical protein